MTILYWIVVAFIRDEKKKRKKKDGLLGRIVESLQRVLAASDSPSKKRLTYGFLKG